MLIELRAGEGGADAELFAAELAAAVTAYLRRANTDPTVIDGAGRTVTISVPGPPVPALCRLAGTHRIQRIPIGDRGGRRHTSTATVAVLDRADEGLAVPVVSREDCDVEEFRGSGPGGQHRNKTATNVRVTHRASGMVAVGSSSRSQHRNLESALDDLSARLAADQVARAGRETNAARRAQIASGERPTKQFTWNTQRMTVTDHGSGRSWPLKTVLKGRLELLG